MSGSILFFAELAIFSVALCGLHALRDRLSLAPIYITLGLLEAFLFFVTKGDTHINVELYTGHPVTVAYTLVLPMMLGVMIMLYILDGTREARRLLIAMLVLYVFHGALDVIISYHAHHPPVGTAFEGDNMLVDYSLRMRLASFTAFVADAVVAAAVYQGLVNRVSWLGHTVPLYVAFVAAMLVDGIVYSIVLVGAQPEVWNFPILEKALIGLAAGIPIAAYVEYQLRRNKEHLEAGRLERGAFDLVDLRRKVRETERKLKEQRAQFLLVKESFSRFVPPAVVDAIVEDPRRLKLGGELLDVTVLFADIRGYSTLSEGLSPTEIIQLLNRYFQHVADVVFANGGMINEFEGDGILAVFGAPLPLNNHAEHGMRAAIGMLQAVDALNEVCDADGTSAIWKDAGLDRFSIRIGLHSGPAVAGNIGTERRIKYAVIGDTVNTASRIEGLNKITETELLASADTVERLSDERPFDLEDLGEHTVKGRSQTVHVYTVSEETRQTVYGDRSSLVL